MSKTTTKNTLQSRVREVQAKLANLEKVCYGTPEASSVRPAISQASAALNSVAFNEQVERLEV